jgi:hypothetical protein
MKMRVDAFMKLTHRFVGRLMLTQDALRVCPHIVLINGEDLTPYREASKRIYNVLSKLFMLVCACACLVLCVCLYVLSPHRHDQWGGFDSLP